MEFMQTFTAVLKKEEDMYVAECPEVGTVSQGRSIDEALANLKEATELYKKEFLMSSENTITLEEAKKRHKKRWSE